MIKRLTLTMLLVFCYLSASAQIATPQLDRVMNVKSAAAAGWRDSSTVGLQAFSVEGKSENNETENETGDTVYGAMVETGDASIGGAIPAVVAALKGEAIGLELYVSTDKTQKNEFIGGSEYEQKMPETRLNLAYVFGETLSIGVGYRLNETKAEYKDASSGYVGKGDKKETGLMVSASLKLGDIFYIAGGMENVDFTLNDSDNDPTNPDADYDSSWSNTIAGLGVLVGDPGESRFRVEYAIIQSPESESSPVYRNASHYKTDQSIMSLEAQFGGFLLSYINDTKKVSEAATREPTVTIDDETVISQIGAGWAPEEGFIVSAYMVDFKKSSKSTSGYEEKANATGYQLNLGWNF